MRGREPDQQPCEPEASEGQQSRSREVHASSSAPTCVWVSFSEALRGRSAAAALALSIAMMACAHGSPRVDEEILHVRALVGVFAGDEAGRSLLVVAECQKTDGDPATLTVSLVRPSGLRIRVWQAEASEAEETARALSEGVDLRERLRAPAWEPPPPRGSWPLGGSLGGMHLLLERRREPRYGKAWVAVLRDEAVGDETVLGRTPAGHVELIWLSSDLAVVATSSPGQAHGFHTADLIPLDLHAGAAELLTTRARYQIDAGRLAEAAGALDRAEALAPEVAALWFERARLLAATEGSPTRLLDALDRAIRHDPTLYRMKARTSPAFLPLRRDPAFLALTHPRALPGSNRAGRPAPAPEAPPPAPPAESQPLEPRPPESQPLEPQPLEPQPLEPQPLEPQPLEPQLLEPQPLEPQPLEPQPFEPQPLEPQPLDSPPEEPGFQPP